LEAVPFFERGTRLAEPEGDGIIHNSQFIIHNAQCDTLLLSKILGDREG